MLKRKRSDSLTRKPQISGSSEQGHPSSLLKADSSSPHKKNMIPNDLHQLDNGRCLITQKKKPLAAMEQTWICQRGQEGSIKGTPLWATQMSEDEIESAFTGLKNTITLRADWRKTYENGDWMLVPSYDILKRMLCCDKTSYEMPYPGYDPNELQDYVFVPLASLEIRYIFRQTRILKEDVNIRERSSSPLCRCVTPPPNDYETISTSISTATSCSHDIIQYASKRENVIPSTYIQDSKRNFAIFQAPFSNFPRLKHHAHPLLVILNALNVLGRVGHPLRLMYNDQHELIIGIRAVCDKHWVEKIHIPPMQSREEIIPGRGKVTVLSAAPEDKVLPQQVLAPVPSNHSCMSMSSIHSRHKFRSYDEVAVKEWAQMVADAGALEEWESEEDVRKPVQDWNMWNTPYEKPQDPSMYASCDWAMQEKGVALWKTVSLDGKAVA